MADIELQTELGPEFEVTISTAKAETTENFEIEVSTADELTIEVGTQYVVVPGPSTGPDPVEPPVAAEMDPLVSVEVEASEVLNAYRAVTQDGYRCSNLESDLGKYAGVIQTATITGEKVRATRVGKITEPGWTWTPNAPIFISTNGVLTQTMPSGFVKRIAWAVTSTEIALDPYPTIGV